MASDVQLALKKFEYKHRAGSDSDKKLGKTKPSVVVEDAVLPNHVMHMCEQFNPDDINLPVVEIGSASRC